MTESPLAPLIASPIAPLCRAVNALPADVSISLLYQGNLPDSSAIFIARNAQDKPLAIVQLSAPASPGMVARGAARARDAAACMGPALARSVLLPTSEGEIDGRSYAIMPYCLGFSSSRPRWIFERMRLRPVVLDWLRDIAERTVAPVHEADLSLQYERPLRNLLALAGASPSLRLRTEQALQRLASGAWCPRHVLMHADLWKGNLLLRQGDSSGARRGFAERVAVIDWAGAKPRGYAFYDLVRVADSLRLSPRGLRAEVLRHCEVLGCEPVDVPGYLLAAIGGLLGELEEFPVERLTSMAESSLCRLLEALPASQRAEQRAAG